MIMKNRYLILIAVVLLFSLFLFGNGQVRTQAQAAWNCNQAYSTGNLVTYNGHTWQALLNISAGQCGWIPGQAPTVWQDNGVTGGSTATNTPQSTIPNPTNTPVPPTNTPVPPTATSSGGGGGSCTTPYVPGNIYAVPTTVSYQGHNWTNKWWTQNEAPSTGGSGVWVDNGACGGSVTNTPVPTVTPNGPTATPCSGSSWNLVTSTQFGNWFTHPASIYTYANFITALCSYPAFANSGNGTNDKIEAAAFFAHVAHESGYLVYTDEQNYTPGHYSACGTYPCAAGQDYHGRGPLQISWNYNYYMAATGLYYCGNATYCSPVGWVSRMLPTVGADVYNNPNLVSTDGVVSWKTALWFWMNHGLDWDPIKTTPHQDIAAGGRGFGATTDDINGGIECLLSNYPNGTTAPNTGAMQDRVNIYNTYLGNLGVSDSRTKTC